MQLRSYFLSLFAAAMMISLLQSLCVKTVLRRVVMLGCGLLIAFIMLKPLLHLKFGDITAYMEQYTQEEDIDDDALEENRALAGQIILEQTRSYILDKARALGVDVDVVIHLRALSEHYSYPYAAVITGDWNESQRSELARYMEEILGIPGERQTWNKKNP